MKIRFIALVYAIYGVKGQAFLFFFRANKNEVNKQTCFCYTTYIEFPDYEEEFYLQFELPIIRQNSKTNKAKSIST